MTPFLYHKKIIQNMEIEDPEFIKALTEYHSVDMPAGWHSLVIPPHPSLPVPVRVPGWVNLHVAAKLLAKFDTARVWVYFHPGEDRDRWLSTAHDLGLSGAAGLSGWWTRRVNLYDHRLVVLGAQGVTYELDGHTEDPVFVLGVPEDQTDLWCRYVPACRRSEHNYGKMVICSAITSSPALSRPIATESEDLFKDREFHWYTAAYKGGKLERHVGPIRS